MFNPSEYANNGAGRDIAQFHKVVTQISEYRQAKFNRQLTAGALDYERKGGDPREYVFQKLQEKEQAETGSFMNRLRAPKTARPSSEIEQRLVDDSQYAKQTDARADAQIKVNAARTDLPKAKMSQAVSYTHLTLPTIYSV